MVLSQMSNQQRWKLYYSRAMLANCVELSANVVTEIVGNEVSDTIEGERVTRKELAQTLAKKIDSYLLNTV